MSIFPTVFDHIRRLVCISMIFLLLSSCSVLQPPPPVGAQEVLSAILSSETAPPAGEIRTKSMTDTSINGQLNDNLLAALYGSECLSWFDAGDGSQTPLVDEIAVYLSTVQHPFEVAVFRCVDSAGTVAAAKQCARRLDAIRQAWRGSDEEAVCQMGCVEVVGNYVILAVTPSPEAAFKAARKIIG